METLFIGVACTEDALDEAKRKYYNNVGQVRPQQYFDFSLVSGLSNYCRVTGLSLPPVAAYPRSNCLFYRRKPDKVSDSLTINYISLLNFLGIKTIIIMFYVFFYTLFFCIKNRNKDVKILLGSILFYTAIPALIVGRLFGRKVFISVPDVPEYIGSYTKSGSKIRTLMDKSSLWLNGLFENRFDGYILLTEQMNEIVNLHKKPYIVMEGMFNLDHIQPADKDKNPAVKIIMYAGTLHEKFGIRKLTEAFKLTKSDYSELWVFGQGDYLERLKAEAAGNKNIKYKGSVGRSEILKYESLATLLVNPRPSSEEFTKFSFPSKTIEYMVSGTPLLTTRLPGIPQEYFDYVYSFEKEEAGQMAEEIDRILSMSQDSLNAFGFRAKEFVVKNKNNKVQTRKIYEFLK